MKVCKALKVLSITASLLGSSFPAYAQETSSGGGWFSTWRSWLSGSDNSEEDQPEEEYSSSAGRNRPPRRPDLNKISEEEGYEQYRRNIDINQLICTGNIPQVQLSGVDDLMVKISNACNVSGIDQEFRNGDSQNSLAFCHEINNRFGNGACFSDIINDASTEYYQNQFYNNPDVREKFAGEIAEQLAAEQERMSELRSLQFTIANDPQSLIDLKEELFHKIKDSDEAYNSFKDMFHLDDATAGKIKDGSIPLNDFSSAIFQCTPDKITRLANENPFDQNFVDPCGNPAADELLEEVKQGLSSQLGASLIHGHPAQGAIDFYDEIDDEYKMMTSAITTGIGRGSEDEVKEMMSTVYLEDAKLLLSAMDAQRGNKAKIPLVRSIRNIMSDESLSDEQKNQKVRGEALRETISSLSSLYENEPINKSIIQAININLVVESPDGISRLDFGDRNAMEIISHIKTQVGLTDDSFNNQIGTITKLVSSGMTFGSQMYESQKLRDDVTGFGGSLLPPTSSEESSGHSVQTQDNAKNSVLNRFRDYLSSGQNSEHGRKQFDEIAQFIQNQKQMSGVCETPVAEFKENLLLVAGLLAQDCNSLINRKPERVAHRYCPNLVNPMNANVMLQGILSDPSSMEGNSQNTISNVLIACMSMEAHAIWKDSSQRGSGEQNTQEQASLSCEFISRQGTISGEANEFSLSYCNPENALEVTLAEGFAGGGYKFNGLLSPNTGSFVSVPTPPGSRVDVVETAELSYKNLVLGTSGSKKISSSKGSASLFDTYNGHSIDTPMVPASTSMVNSTSTSSAGIGAVASSGINSNIFSTNNVSTPVTSSSFLPRNENFSESEDVVSSEELRREIEDSNGGVDPNIQKILDKMAAMEEREKSLIEEQNKLRSLINNPVATAEAEELDDGSQSDLEAVTAELDALKKEMSELVSDARSESNNSSNDNYRVSNFTGPSASPTPSSRERSPASTTSNFNANSGGASGSSLPSSGSSRSSAVSSAGGNGYSAGGGISGNVSPDGLSTPAYTQNETFVLTQSIREKAPIMPAGVSIEQAVLENKGAILVPYGNGQYMYVEPEMSENGDILTRDGRVVYKEVLKVSDPEVIASRAQESGERAPASVEEFDPSEKIYDWDDFSRQLDEAQN